MLFLSICVCGVHGYGHKYMDGQRSDGSYMTDILWQNKEEMHNILLQPIHQWNNVTVFVNK
jgi:hypothetical protein